MDSFLPIVTVHQNEFETEFPGLAGESTVANLLSLVGLGEQGLTSSGIYAHLDQI